MENTRIEGIKELAKALIATVIILVISKALSNTVLSGFNDAVYKTFYSKVIMTILVLIAVIILKKMRIHLFRFRLLFAGLLSGLFFVILILFRLLIAPEVTTDTGTRMIIFTVSMLLVGYTEEALFRGLIQNALHKIFGENSWQAVWAACFVAGIFFGAAHLSNIFETGISVPVVLVQALGNVFIGVYLCAMYYRTGKCLWYVTILHALNDFCAFLATGFLAPGGSTAASISSTAATLGTDSLLQMIPGLALVYLLPALIILRPKKVKPLLGEVVI